MLSMEYRHHVGNLSSTMGIQAYMVKMFVQKSASWLLSWCYSMSAQPCSDTVRMLPVLKCCCDCDTSVSMHAGGHLAQSYWI